MRFFQRLRTLELAAIAVCLLLLIAITSCGGDNNGGDEVPQDGGGRPPVGTVSEHVDRPGRSLRVGFNVAL